MILWLLENFEGTPLWNLFHYVTFRAAFAAVTAFLTAVLLGPRVIAMLRRRKIGENTEKTDSATLAEMSVSKKGTPTMGGILIIAAVEVAVLLFGRLSSAHVQMALLATLGFGAVGFIDDWIKLSYKNRPGLAAASKMGLLVFVSCALAIGIVIFAERSADVSAYAVRFPFLKNLELDLSFGHGVLYLLFAMCVMVAASNSVNLTDGLDGLATGCAAIASVAFTLILYVTGRADWSTYLNLPHIPGAAELTIVCAALGGACIGFLWFNAFPAQVFMGDTGSLTIGGLLGFLAVVAKQELVLLIVGGVFVVEALSVILQVGSFKTRGKRIFRCAPIHHHFQFAGWHEVKVVVRFWIVAVVFAIAGLATLKVR